MKCAFAVRYDDRSPYLLAVMAAGTSISKYYRFLSKNNEWCWLQTRATIVYNTAKQPQYIVCMNYIVR